MDLTCGSSGAWTDYKSPGKIHIVGCDISIPYPSIPHVEKELCSEIMATIADRSREADEIPTTTSGFGPGFSAIGCTWYTATSGNSQNVGWHDLSSNMSNSSQCLLVSWYFMVNFSLDHLIHLSPSTCPISQLPWGPDLFKGLFPSRCRFVQPALKGLGLVLAQHFGGFTCPLVN